MKLLEGLCGTAWSVGQRVGCGRWAPVGAFSPPAGCSPLPGRIMLIQGRSLTCQRGAARGAAPVGPGGAAGSCRPPGCPHESPSMGSGIRALARERVSSPESPLLGWGGSGVETGGVSWVGKASSGSFSPPPPLRDPSEAGWHNGDSAGVAQGELFIAMSEAASHPD